MASKKVVVRSWDEALDVLDGKHLVLDGVDGTLRVNRRRDQYGAVLTGVLMHVPSAKGKKSAKYLEIKRQLHDDWDTDLTGSERVAEIAEKFCVFANDVAPSPKVRTSRPSYHERMTDEQWTLSLQNELDHVFGGWMTPQLMKDWAALIHTSRGIRRPIADVVKDIRKYEKGA
jgi:hypothetical protein